MIRVFQKWTRLEEVFISCRPNRWGRRYGFVRFFDVVNLGRLQKKLDRIYIGNMKLQVDVLRFSRDGLEEGGQTRGGRSQNSKVPTKITRVEVRKEVWKLRKDKQSYADAVKTSHIVKWKRAGFGTKSQVLPWMVSSVVGKMLPDLDFYQLREEFFKGGMSMVRVRYMGDNLVLLTPKEGECMDDNINLNKEWFDSVLGDFKPWSESLDASHRLVC